MNKLNKCPYCESAVVIIPYAFGSSHGATCGNDNCRLSKVIIMSEEWNNRPIEDKLRSEIHHWMHLFDIKLAELDKVKDKLRFIASHHHESMDNPSDWIIYYLGGIAQEALDELESKDEC